MSYAGHLDKTVKIKDSVKGEPDGLGGYLPPVGDAWVTIYKRIKAARVPIPKGEQIIQYNKIDVFAEIFWYMEFLSAVKEGQRICWGSIEDEVKLVLPWRYKGRFMKLVCVEIGRAI